MSYFGDINKGIKTTLKGLSLTWRHLFDARYTRGPINVQDGNYFQVEAGHVTLQYPQEKLEVPDNGRYQLDCEIDDCIVCDKCAKVCPVDCIDIEVVKSPELIRTTSDGSPVRLHAAKFDIDMAKCCFCGLCTTVCPTECLTMDSEYDFSVLDIDEMNFEFANLTEAEVTEKKQLYEQFVAEKATAKEIAAASAIVQPKPSGNRPAFRPGMKPPVAKPAFKPTAKPSEDKPSTDKDSDTVPPAKPVGFKPTIKPPAGRPSFRPTTNPPVVEPEKAGGGETTSSPKPIGFKPTIRPPVGKPVFKPSMKPPKKKGEDE
jgi:formate hydrogenlyase subunit 6/NADH:ubiquinone oxidoreductase subunit I